MWERQGVPVALFGALLLCLVGLAASADVLVLRRDWIPTVCADGQAACGRDASPDAFRVEGLFLASDAGAAPVARSDCDGNKGLSRAALEDAGVPLADLECALFNPDAQLKSQQAGWRGMWGAYGRCTDAQDAPAYLGAALALDQAYPLPQDLPGELSGAQLEAAVAAAFGARPYVECGKSGLAAVSLCFEAEGAFSGRRGAAPKPINCPWASRAQCGGQLEVPRSGQGLTQGCERYYRGSPVELKAAAPAPAPVAAPARVARTPAPARAAGAGAATAQAKQAARAPASGPASGVIAAAASKQQAPAPAPGPDSSAVAAAAAAAAAVAQAQQQAEQQAPAADSSGGEAAGSTGESSTVAATTQGSDATAPQGTDASTSSGSDDGTSTGAMVGALLGGVAAGVLAGGAALGGAYYWLKRRRSVQAASASSSPAKSAKSLGSDFDLEKAEKGQQRGSSGSRSRTGSASSWSDGDSGGAQPAKRQASGSSSTSRNARAGAAAAAGGAAAAIAAAGGGSLPASPSLPHRTGVLGRSATGARGSSGSLQSASSPNGSFTRQQSQQQQRGLQRSRSDATHQQQLLVRTGSEGTSSLRSFALRGGDGSPTGLASALQDNPLWRSGSLRSLNGWATSDNPLSDSGSGSGSGDVPFDAAPERSRLSSASLASLNQSPSLGGAGSRSFSQARTPSRARVPVGPPEKKVKYVQPVRQPSGKQQQAAVPSPPRQLPRTPSKLDRLYSMEQQLPAVDE